MNPLRAGVVRDLGALDLYGGVGTWPCQAGETALAGGGRDPHCGGVELLIELSSPLRRFPCCGARGGAEMPRPACLAAPGACDQVVVLGIEAEELRRGDVHFHFEARLVNQPLEREPDELLL